jgi:hypothetical protein
MGTQQLLLVIVGLIVVGIAIAVGVAMFGASSVSTNKDSLVNDINNLAAHAKQYRSKLRAMGGGGGSYLGYLIPVKLQDLDDGSFEVSIQDADIVVTATSAYNFGTVQATIDSNGTSGNWTYTGDFR